MFPWDNVRIILNVKKTLPLLVVALIVDIIAYSLRPDWYLFVLGVGDSRCGDCVVSCSGLSDTDTETDDE